MANSVVECSLAKVQNKDFVKNMLSDMCNTVVKHCKVSDTLEDDQLDGCLMLKIQKMNIEEARKKFEEVFSKEIKEKKAKDQNNKVKKIVNEMKRKANNNKKI